MLNSAPRAKIYSYNLPSNTAKGIVKTARYHKDSSVLVGNPAPHLRAYPREAVVPEKYQALLNLGIADSPMKDSCDLWGIARELDFDGANLSEAISNTFSRHQTPLPEYTPSGLSADF